MNVRSPAARSHGTVFGLMLALIVVAVAIGPAGHLHHDTPDRTPCHACVHGKAPAPSLGVQVPLPLPPETRLAAAEPTSAAPSGARPSGLSTRAPPAS